MIDEEKKEQERLEAEQERLYGLIKEAGERGDSSAMIEKFERLEAISPPSRWRNRHHDAQDWIWERSQEDPRLAPALQAMIERGPKEGDPALSRTMERMIKRENLEGLAAIWPTWKHPTDAWKERLGDPIWPAAVAVGFRGSLRALRWMIQQGEDLHEIRHGSTILGAAVSGRANESGLLEMGLGVLAEGFDIRVELRVREPVNQALRDALRMQTPGAAEAMLGAIEQAIKRADLSPQDQERWKDQLSSGMLEALNGHARNELDAMAALRRMGGDPLRSGWDLYGRHRRSPLAVMEPTQAIEALGALDERQARRAMGMAWLREIRAGALDDALRLAETWEESIDQGVIKRGLRKIQRAPRELDHSGELRVRAEAWLLRLEAPAIADRKPRPPAIRV